MYCVRRFSSILAGTAVVLCVFCLLGSTLVASAANAVHSGAPNRSRNASVYMHDDDYYDDFDEYYDDDNDDYDDDYDDDDYDDDD